jgi:hypothetical protein
MVSELTDRIRSRAYWDVVIRPQSFREDRVPYEDLESIVERCAVRLRGWPLPYLSDEQLVRGEDRIGQETDAPGGHLEAWRFFTSGQFLQLSAISADWRRKNVDVHDEGAGHESVIAVWEILYYLTEVYEFAARLALTPAGDDPIVIETSLYGLADRALIAGQRNRAPFMSPFVSKVRSLSFADLLSRDDLIANSRTAAIKMARKFLIRFGWTPSIEQLAGAQAELPGLS